MSTTKDITWIRIGDLENKYLYRVKSRNFIHDIAIYFENTHYHIGMIPVGSFYGIASSVYLGQGIDFEYHHDSHATLGTIMPIEKLEPYPYLYPTDKREWKVMENWLEEKNNDRQTTMGKV